MGPGVSHTDGVSNKVFAGTGCIASRAEFRWGI